MQGSNFSAPKIAINNKIDVLYLELIDMILKIYEGLRRLQRKLQIEKLLNVRNKLSEIQFALKFISLLVRLEQRPITKSFMRF